MNSSALSAIPQLYDWVSTDRPAGVRKRPFISTGRSGPMEGRRFFPGGSNTVIVLWAGTAALQGATIAAMAPTAMSVFIRATSMRKMRPLLIGPPAADRKPCTGGIGSCLSNSTVRIGRTEEAGTGH